MINLLLLFQLLNGPLWTDDDPYLAFVWTPPEGSYNGYNVYVSVDDSPFKQVGRVESERYTILAENAHVYRLSVAATLNGLEGAMSPASDHVLCQSTTPRRPRMLSQ